jgi:hypothetical protein
MISIVRLTKVISHSRFHKLTSTVLRPDLDEWYTSQICANEDCHYKIGKRQGL